MTIAGYRIVQFLQHYSIVNGAVYRDAIAIRLVDGERRLISVLDA